MRTFYDLLPFHSGVWPPLAQERAKADFPEVLKQHGLAGFKPGQPIPSAGTFTLIGVAASWVYEELILLDEIYPILKAQPEGTVAIFDVSQVRDQDEMNLYVPGIGQVHQTPILACWHDGVLTEKAWGAKARDLICERFKS